MKLKVTLLGALFIISTISAVIMTAPTYANTNTTSRTQATTLAKIWQIFAPGSCTRRENRKRANISRARNDACPKISR